MYRNVWRQLFPVFLNTVVVGGKHKIKRRSQVNKSIKKGAVILVPEYSRYVPLTRQIQQFEYSAGLLQAQPTRLACQFVAPGSPDSMKGRLHKHQIRFPAGDYVLVISRSQTTHRTICSQTRRSKVIGYQGNLQGTKG